MTDESPSGQNDLVEHQLTRDEVVPFFYWQVLHSWKNYVLPLIGLCLLVAGVSVLVTSSVDKVAWTILIALGGVILLIVGILVPLTPKRIWRRVGRQFEVRRLRISDEGIRRETVDSDSMMRWSMFSETSQRDGLYILRRKGGRGTLLIPRRAFASDSDEQIFRRFAERFTSAELSSSAA